MIFHLLTVILIRFPRVEYLGKSDCLVCGKHYVRDFSLVSVADVGEISVLIGKVCENHKSDNEILEEGFQDLLQG